MADISIAMQESLDGILGAGKFPAVIAGILDIPQCLGYQGYIIIVQFPHVSKYSTTKGITHEFPALYYVHM